MVRIRYTRNENGTLVSKPIEASGEIYTVSLIPSELTFVVVNSLGAIVAKDTATTLARTKIAAKKAMQSLGVSFFDELRKGKHHATTATT